MSGGELLGDGAQKISGAASLAEATAGEISFFGNPKYAAQLRKTRASAIFVPLDFSEHTGQIQIRVSNPAKAFEQIVLKFAPKPVTFSPGIHLTAVVDPSASIGQGVSLQPYVVVEAGVSIGDNTVIGAGTYVGQDSTVGANCMVYPRVTVRERTQIG